MSQSVPETSPKLTAADRLTLIQTLNALPSAQFEELLIALNPPKGNIPTDTAAQAMRSKALFEWIESPIGPGIPELETLLGMIISKESKAAPEFLSFAISGTISSKTVAEVRAIVELLRKKTGDDSIDVAFFKEGSINIILSGSPESLQKLQEQFESEELENLGIFPVEAVHYISNTTHDARKARLVQVLRLESIGYTANAFNNALNHARDLFLDLNLEDSFLPTRTYNSIERYRDLASALALASDPERMSISNFERARERAQALASTLESEVDSILTQALELTQNLVSTLEHTHHFASKLEHQLKLRNPDLSNTNINLASELERIRDRNFEHQLKLRNADLSNTNLKYIYFRNADLTETDFTSADLARADLTGSNLTGANFTGADVTETVFGENLGLTEASKFDLQRRGAILLDPPSSDDRILVRG